MDMVEDFLFGRNPLGKPIQSSKFNEGRRVEKCEKNWFEGIKFRGRYLNLALLSCRISIW